MPRLAIAVCRAAVPELVAMQWATPRYSAQSRSSPATAGASAPHSVPRSRTAITSARSASVMSGHAACSLASTAGDPPSTASVSMIAMA